jgi:hypothetical protein
MRSAAGEIGAVLAMLVIGGSRDVRLLGSAWRPTYPATLPISNSLALGFF